MASGGTQPPIAIEARGIVREFGTVRALDGLNLAIPEGTLYGLIGPSGSGKTTLIRILMGLDEPTSGRALLYGESQKARVAEIGYMPQEEAIYPDLTPYENLEFFCGLYGAPVRDLAPDVLRYVKLWDARDRPVRQLSGGMRRRVSLAIALLHRPCVFFLDEPTVGLDPLLRNEFWNGFRVLAQQGATLLITTHHVEEARRCDRLGLLWRGKMFREQTPRELMDAAGTDNLEEAFVQALKEAGLAD